MSHRFFSQESIQSDQLTLRDDQAHHLIHVMRYKVGDEVTVFDGSGIEATAKITQQNKREVQLVVINRDVISRELQTELTMAVAIPKGDRQKFLVEKLVEVGVTKLIPLNTSRSVAQPSSKSIDRLVKNVIAASKQCERNTLMEISPSVSFDEVCTAAKKEDCLKLIATTHGETTPIGQVKPASQVLIAIGPEGGFSQSENELAREAGFRSIGLGPAILRVETAAITVAACMGIGRLSSD